MAGEKPILEWSVDEAEARRAEIVTQHGADLTRLLGVGCRKYIEGSRDSDEAKLFMEYDQLEQVIDRAQAPQVATDIGSTALS